MQLELRDREELVPDVVQMVNQEKEHYVEECVAVRIEKEEIKHVSARLKMEK